jgi:aldehyde:ferredoxin oxidoreductase
MNGGYVDHVLWVDLTNEEMHTSSLSDEAATNFISDRGLSAKDEQNLMLIGERFYNQERLFNVKEGFSHDDDVLSEDSLTEQCLQATLRIRCAVFGRCEKNIMLQEVVTRGNSNSNQTSVT